MLKQLTPAMKEQFDTALRKIIKKPPVNGFEEKLIVFLGLELKPVLAFGLVNKYKKTKGIDLLDNLPVGEQKEFVHIMFNHVFGRTKSQQDTDWMIAQFFENT